MTVPIQGYKGCLEHSTSRRLIEHKENGIAAVCDLDSDD